MHSHLNLGGHEAISSGVPELRTFATGIQRDQAAVLAALTYPWSQGQVEGQVHRLKLLKRQSYGRAGFDLLRHRVLARKRFFYELINLTREPDALSLNPY